MDNKVNFNLVDAPKDPLDIEIENLKKEIHKSTLSRDLALIEYERVLLELKQAQARQDTIAFDLKTKKYQEEFDEKKDSTDFGMVRYAENIATVSGYYVYAVMVNGVFKYIGEGTGDRFYHGISGKSSCRLLNRDVFAGKKIKVFCVKSGIKNKTEAVNLESRCIKYAETIEKLYNSTKLPQYLVPNIFQEQDLTLLVEVN